MIVSVSCIKEDVFNKLSKVPMKFYTKIVIIITLFFAAIGAEHAHADELFPYPVPPDSMMELQPRCDYIISRFWDRCNFGTVFNYRQKLHNTMGSWFAIMQHASADTVHSSIDKLLQIVAKDGKKTLALAEMAEEWLYSDTTEMRSDEVYLPFVQAAAHHKKIDKATRARYQAQEKILLSSSIGSTLPEIELIQPDGNTTTFGQIKGKSILLFFNDPDCDDCSMANVRLKTNIHANRLIDNGDLVIISLYPGEANQEWKDANSALPNGWIAVSCEDADLYFDLRTMPSFYFINSKHRILAKDLDLDYLFGAFQVAAEQTRRN